MQVWCDHKLATQIQRRMHSTQRLHAASHRSVCHLSQQRINRRKVDTYFEKSIRRQMPTVSPLTVTRAYDKTLSVAPSSRERMGTYLLIPTASTPSRSNTANNPFCPSSSHSPNAAPPPHPPYLGPHDALHIHDASVGQAFA